jgi:hypothetical protein
MKIHLFIWIGGGVPRSHTPDDPDEDVNLGDVVVSWTKQMGIPAVIQYDLARREPGIEGWLLGILDKPGLRLLNAIGVLLANHEKGQV